MEAQWGPTLVTAAIALAGWLITFGTLRQATQQNTEAIGKLELAKGEIWREVNEHNRELGEIKATLAAASRGPSNGLAKGAHV